MRFSMYFLLVGVCMFLYTPVFAQLRPSYFDDRVIPQQTVYQQEGEDPKTNATGCALFTQTLYTGITDADAQGEVSRLQSFLKVKIGKGPTDATKGVYDDATEWAVRAYQKKHDILKMGLSCKTGYGIVEYKTRNHINATNDCTPVIPRKTVSCSGVPECPLLRTNLTKGTTDAEGVRGSVSTLQCHLKRIGLYSGPINGIFGSTVQSAVTNYQTTRKLGVTGAVNAQTREALSQCAAATVPIKAEPGRKAKSSQYTLRVDPARGKAPLNVSVTFAFNGSTCSSYEISWGDGTLADSYDAGRPATCSPLPVTQTYTHTYARPGTYDVTVRQGEDALSRLPVSNSAQVIVE